MAAFRLLFALVLTATPALGDTVVAAGTIRGQALIGPTDVALIAGDTPGAIGNLGEVIGMEARVNIYPGRPIRTGDIAPPAVIERNDIVTLRYEHGGLVIITEGRALERAAVGDLLRVINLSSRNTVTARATAPGLASVGPL